MDDQSFLWNINAFEGWQEVLDDTNPEQVTVAVIDSGASVNHADVQANMWTNDVVFFDGPGAVAEFPNNCQDGIDNDRNGYVDDCQGYNFAENTGSFLGGEGSHGMHVAGVISAETDNGIGVASVGGIQGVTKVMILTTFGRTRQGGFGEALAYAADMGAGIAQNSWGYTTRNVFPYDVRVGIDYFVENAGSGIAPAADVSLNAGGVAASMMLVGRDRSASSSLSPSSVERASTSNAGVEREGGGGGGGGIVVFAAGNLGEDGAYYPAFYADVIAVGAAAVPRRAERLSGYSNRGSWVDVLAVGTNVMSTVLNSSYGYKTGTSMAAPQVSATFALMRSVNPDIDTDDAVACMYGSASPGAPYGTANGLIDVGEAVRCAADRARMHETPCPQWSQWSSCEVDCDAAQSEASMSDRDVMLLDVMEIARERKEWSYCDVLLYMSYVVKDDELLTSKFAFASSIWSQMTNRVSAVTIVHAAMKDEQCSGKRSTRTATTTTARGAPSSSSSASPSASSTTTTRSRSSAFLRSTIASADADANGLLNADEMLVLLMKGVDMLHTSADVRGSSARARRRRVPVGNTVDSVQANDGTGESEFERTQVYGERRRSRVAGAEGSGCPASIDTKSCRRTCNLSDGNGGGIFLPPSPPPPRVPGCFPGTALVLMEDGSEKRMQDLEFGDRVAFVTSAGSESGDLHLSIGIGKGTPVLAFAHRSEAAAGTTTLQGEGEEIYLMHVVGISSGNTRAVEATGNHLVPVDVGSGEDSGVSVVLMPTRNVVSGMKLIVAVGVGAGHEVETATVISIEKRMRVTSLIAPVTMASSLIVDGVAFSCATEHMALSHVGQTTSRASFGARFDDAIRDAPISALLAPLWMLDWLRRASESTVLHILHMFM